MASMCRSGSFAALAHGLLLFWISTVALASGEGHYLYDHWGLEEGLPQNTVGSIVEGPRGYLWLATVEGLARFDGVRFDVFDRRTHPELRSDSIRDLVRDPDGGLWVATRQGLGHYEGGRFTLYTTADGLLHMDVQTLHLDPAGILWIGTTEGLSRFDPRAVAFTHFSTDDGLVHDSVWVLHTDRTGHLWIGTSGGLSRFAGGRFTSYTTHEGLSHDHIYCLYEDRQSRLLIGTGSGVDRIENGAPAPVSDPASTAWLNERSPVWTLTEDAAGTLWAGTERGLVRAGPDGSWTPFKGLDGPPRSRIRVLRDDGAGGLFVGTHYEGLGRLRERRIRHFGEGRDWAGERVWTVLEDHPGDIWIGTDRALVHLAKTGEERRLTTADGLPGQSVRALFEDSSGRLWIGTLRGLAFLDDGRLGIRTRDDGRPYPQVNCMGEARGALFFGTHGDGLHILENGEVTVYKTEDGLPHNVVRDLYAEDDGTLWIATDGGVSRFDANGFTTIDTTRGLSHDQISSLEAGADGSLWISTWGGGLNRLRDGEIFSYSEDSGLFDDFLFHVIDDRRGRLWLASPKGLFSVDHAGLESVAAGDAAAIHSVVYDEYDGLESRECSGGSQPAGWHSRDGELWITTRRGIALVDPEQLVPSEEPPPVVIEEVRAAGRILARDVSADQPAVVPAGTRAFSFHYAAPSFAAPHQIHYRYRLEDLDEEWTEVGATVSASYPHLPAGTYRFHVTARDRYGTWNLTGATFELRLRPHFYETWYFYAVLAVAAAFLTRWLHGLRVGQLTRRNEQLRRIQAELQAKNEELERFTYTVSHDLKSPLFTIQGFLGLLEKDALAGKEKRIREDVRRIRGACEKMRSLLDELLELSRVGRMKNTVEEVALDELVGEAVELVAGAIGERGVEVVIAPDLGTVRGDRPRLLQVFQNLVDNAVKYMGSQETPKVEIGCRRDGDEDVYFVRDNGMGLRPEHFEQIFGIFQQLHPQDQDGTGIGLTLVKRVVEVHGGRIWVESAGEGMGSTFSFTLPGVD